MSTVNQLIITLKLGEIFDFTIEANLSKKSASSSTCMIPLTCKLCKETQEYRARALSKIETCKCKCKCSDMVSKLFTMVNTLIINIPTPIIDIPVIDTPVITESDIVKTESMLNIDNIIQLRFYSDENNMLFLHCCNSCQYTSKVVHLLSNVTCLLNCPKPIYKPFKRSIKNFYTTIILPYINHRCISEMKELDKELTSGFITLLEMKDDLDELDSENSLLNVDDKDDIEIAEIMEGMHNRYNDLYNLLDIKENEYNLLESKMYRLQKLHSNKDLLNYADELNTNQHYLNHSLIKLADSIFFCKTDFILNEYRNNKDLKTLLKYKHFNELMSFDDPKTEYNIVKATCSNICQKEFYCNVDASKKLMRNKTQCRFCYPSKNSVLEPRCIQLPDTDIPLPYISYYYHTNGVYNIIDETIFNVLTQLPQESLQSDQVIELID